MYPRHPSWNGKISNKRYFRSSRLGVLVDGSEFELDEFVLADILNDRLAQTLQQFLQIHHFLFSQSRIWVNSLRYEFILTLTHSQHPPIDRNCAKRDEWCCQKSERIHNYWWTARVDAKIDLIPWYFIKVKLNPWQKLIENLRNECRWRGREPFWQKKSDKNAAPRPGLCRDDPESTPCLTQSGTDTRWNWSELWISRK